MGLPLAILGSIALLAPAPDDHIQPKIETLVRPMLEAKKTVGMVVGVIRGDATHVYGFGRVATDSDRIPDGKTVYEIGSITKVFTALALADMVERGEVKLDDPVARYFPEGVTIASRDGKEVTLKDLAMHTSSLPRLPPAMISLGLLFPSNPYARFREKDLYDFLAHWKPGREIGSKYEYSNLGAGLLGHVLARKAGMSYEQLIVARICDPLGMADTRITLTPEQRDRMASAYHEGGKPASTWDFDVLAGCGALRSTADDMLTFLDANLGRGPEKLRPALALCINERRETDHEGILIALGWHIIRNPESKREVIWHNGGTGGYRAFIGFSEEEKTGVVLLSNSDADADPVALDILRLLVAHRPAAD
jgi:CubicO group peptidase (beta-lactamase class C family)